MQKAAALFVVLSAVACAPQDDTVTALATKLAKADIPANASPAYRAYRMGYVSCGEEALSYLPRARIQAALKAPDVPAVWATLGSDALDRYVATCADGDLKRGPPPPQ